MKLIFKALEEYDARGLIYYLPLREGARLGVLLKRM